MLGSLKIISWRSARPASASQLAIMEGKGSFRVRVLVFLVSVFTVSVAEKRGAATPTTVPLANTAKPGTRMPVVGIGTGAYSHRPSVPGEDWNDSISAVAIAEWLKLGGRRIDTALDYGTQIGIGEAVVKSGVPREEIFITSKIGGGPRGYNETLQQFIQVLHTLNTSYVDLLLIHWSWPIYNNTADPACLHGEASANSCRVSSWKAMIEIFKSGGAHAIGVSNFEAKHIKGLHASGLPLPAVNQCEFSPYWHEMDLLEYCKANKILFNGYAPLAAPDWAPSSHHWNSSLLDSPVLKKIAAAHSKSPAQVSLQWSLQHNIVINPRTWNTAHMQENLNLNFMLSDTEMNEIANIPKPLNPKVCHNPQLFP